MAPAGILQTPGAADEIQKEKAIPVTLIRQMYKNIYHQRVSIEHLCTAGGGVSIATEAMNCIRYLTREGGTEGCKARVGYGWVGGGQACWHSSDAGFRGGIWERWKSRMCKVRRVLAVTQGSGESWTRLATVGKGR